MSEPHIHEPCCAVHVVRCDQCPRWPVTRGLHWLRWVEIQVRRESDR